MNDLTFDELYVGREESFYVTVKDEDIDAFRQISGDINPLHLDKAFAISQGFKTNVVFGMLVASYYSTLAGVYLPGKKCLLHKVDAQFLKPVYAGDRLLVSGKVIERQDIFKVVMIKAVITNQNTEKVSKAKIQAGILNG